MRITEILVEAVIEPSMEPNTVTLWHGGNLGADFKYRTGRTEYGPGLYLISRYDVAVQYAKGGRKLYMVTVEKGTDTRKVSIPVDAVNKFIASTVVGKKQKDILARILSHVRDGNVKATIVMNVMLNENAILPSRMGHYENF